MRGTKMIKTGNFELDAIDPLFALKYITLQGVTQISVMNRQNRNDRDNIIIFISSILIGIITSIFTNYDIWFMVMLLGNILLIIGIWKVLEYNRQRKDLRKQMRQILLDAKALNMNIPGTEEFL
jgi:uncharacterized membrane protein HdeD (DUF308 family)